MVELILAMSLWGTLGAFVLWSGLSAIDIAFYRCLIAVILISAWLIKTKEKINFDKSTAIVTLAGIFLVMNWIFLFKSFYVSTITIGNISYYLQPIILMILGVFIYKEEINLQKSMLILLALCGVILTIDLQNLYTPNILLGVLFALIAAFLYSLLTLLMKNNTQNYFKVIFIQLLVGALILFPFIHFQVLSYAALACLMIIGLIHTLLAYWLYYRAIQKTSFTQIAVVSYLDPIVAIATDVIFFHRELNLFQLAGVALTFMALFLLVTGGKFAAKKTVDVF